MASAPPGDGQVELGEAGLEQDGGPGAPLEGDDDPGTSALCREVTEALKALQGHDQGQQVGGRSRQTLGPSDLIRGGG